MASLRIILASSSPRRQELLRQAGFGFRVEKPDTPEAERPGEAPAAMVRRLSREKADAILARRKAPGDFMIIAADTTVVRPDGRGVLNKPRNARDAVRILGMIQGRTHTVLTGYTLVGRRQGRVIRHSRVVSTRVSIHALDARARRDYVRTGEPMDKAGAYAAQGIGMTFISGIRGSYTNVVGLPMAELLEDLEVRFGVVPRWKNPGRTRKTKR